MSEVMTEEAFLLLVRELWTIAQKHGDPNDFEAAWKAVRGAYRTAYSAALAAPDPCVGPLVEALEWTISVFSEVNLMLPPDKQQPFEHLNCIIDARAALAAAKGEAAAEEPWTKSEERMPDSTETRVDIRFPNGLIIQDANFSWFAGRQRWCWLRLNGDVETAEIAGTEWRPVREAQ